MECAFDVLLVLLVSMCTRASNLPEWRIVEIQFIYTVLTLYCTYVQQDPPRPQPGSTSSADCT